MIYRFLADAVLVLHLAFIIFVVLGGWFLPRWPRLAWLHVPAAVWGTTIELCGCICPLTPLENTLRRWGGEAGYPGGFVEHYLLAVIYPDALTREGQITLGIGVVIINLAAYVHWWRMGHRQRPPRRHTPCP